MEKYTGLLQQLISTPSFSREEEQTAGILHDFLQREGVRKEDLHREHNNIWAYNRHFDPDKPTILLNSHHDTVQANEQWTRDPFGAEITDVNGGKILYGLGSNDAGASVVSLTAAFLHFYQREDLTYNLLLALTAEEEISGTHGIESILPKLGKIDFAIVGEPTGMQLAIGERGLMVLDCVAHGKAGHAAREEGENAIYKAMDDIRWFKEYEFEKKSDLFGNVKMSVTIIQAGRQHNVVPDTCQFTVDVRVTDQYRNEEVLEIIRQHVKSEVTPRSTRLRSSYIAPSHPIVQAGLKLGRTTYGSPTTSDQSLLDVPSLKMGPGDSARSHTADEYIKLSEIQEGIDIYISMLNDVIAPR